jgi:hypothetical protein
VPAAPELLHYTQRLFELLDLLTMRRLRKAKPFRSMAKVQFFSDYNKVVQLLEGHHLILHSYR